MIEYKNRYGDIFTFEVNERGNIDWKGNFEYCRTGYNDNPADTIMVDPSGGPYIGIGDNMKQFDLEGKVNGFIWRDGYYEIIIKKMGKIKDTIIDQMNDDRLLNDRIIETVMREARYYGLETEVRSTAMALLKENPELDSGSAYHYAALEWDI